MMDGYSLWNKSEELKFFRDTLKIVAPEKLFYITSDGRYLAYWPKRYEGRRTTLQSRNAFVGSYTERLVKNILQPLAKKVGAYAVNNVVCEEISLTERSPADVAIVKSRERYLGVEDILLIVEVKMSIVWNWEYFPETGEVKYIGDYKTHRGNPSLLRSDSMLKAIGKSINIRVSGYKSSCIPIVVIGNTPITESYYKKVDFLKKFGVVQGFFSVNPKPLDTVSSGNIKNTPKGGFMRIDEIEELWNILEKFICDKREFFSSMIPKIKLGEIIELADKESTYEKKAEKFLELLRGMEYE